MMHKLHNLIFTLSIKVVRRIQSHATVKSDDTLEQGALTMHLFIFGHLLFTITFPLAEFIFHLSGSHFKLVFVGILLIEFIYTYYILLRRDKWKEIEKRIDRSMSRARRDRYFGLFALLYIIYYSISIVAFMLMNCTYSSA